MALRQLTTLFAGTLLLRHCIAGYILTDDYQQDSFFSNFTMFTDADPTNGFVQYADYNTALANGYIGEAKNAGDASFLGVDYKTSSAQGRGSVRISSNKWFNKGLFILDVAHMPVGCGTWPAFWLVGPNWPHSGEIDIIEGVNAATTNQMTLHTDAGCTIQNTGSVGRVNTTDCDGNAPGQKNNAGCAIMSSDTTTFGTGLNAIGGGVYATEWSDSSIDIWFFPRSQIPSDITTGTPNPSGWGTPQGHFSGSCDIDQHFQNMQIVFDTTFCGDWAGDKDVWASSGSCAALAPTCQAYVQGNPAAFEEAYWLVNFVKVYQNGTAGTRRRGVSVQVGE